MFQCKSSLAKMDQWLTDAYPDEQKYRIVSKGNLQLRYGILFRSQYTRLIMYRLENEVEYDRPEDSKIRVYGKWFEIPRLQKAYGDWGVEYEYSGKKVEVQEWTPLMEELRDVVNKVCDQSYNFVLVNKYRTGMDRIGYHSDNEPSIDMNVPIASLSFGAERDFIFQDRLCKAEQFKIRLESGSLLMMDPPTNQYWLHSLPPCRDCTTPRVNLTFRKINVC